MGWWLTVSVATSILLLLPLSEFFRRYALHAGEELGEGCLT